MRVFGLFAMILLPAFTSAAELSEDCQRQQFDFVREMNGQVYGAQQALFKHVMVLQKHAKSEDEKEIRGRCERIKSAVEDWEHSSHANARELWRKALNAQNEFAKYMKEMVERDRAGWDKSLKELQAEGYKVNVNYTTFVITATKDLTEGLESRGVQKLKSELDFCSPNATDGDQGSLTTRIVVSERARGTKVITLDAGEYASANMAATCGIQAREGAEFLRINGALHAPKTNVSMRTPSNSRERN